MNIKGLSFANLPRPSFPSCLRISPPSIMFRAESGVAGFRILFLLELLFNFGKRVRHSFARQRKRMRNPATPDSARNIIDGGEMRRQEGKGGWGELTGGKPCIFS